MQQMDCDTDGGLNVCVKAAAGGSLSEMSHRMREKESRPLFLKYGNAGDVVRQRSSINSSPIITNFSHFYRISVDG